MAAITIRHDKRRVSILPSNVITNDELRRFKPSDYGSIRNLITAFGSIRYWSSAIGHSAYRAALQNCQKAWGKRELPAGI
jgi:hypothetical protein